MDTANALEIFNKALEISDPAERNGYLLGACGDDAELLAHVRQLLAGSEGAEDIFPTEPGDDKLMGSHV